MKKVLSFALVLVLVFCAASQAYAASYLSVSRVKRLLKQESDNMVDTFALDSGEECVYTFIDNRICIFLIEGNKDNILKFIVLFDENSYSNETAALKACNEWNKEKRYPTMLLSLDNRKFVLDNNLMCTSDVTDDMIAEFISNQLFGTKQAIEFLQEKGFSV